MSGLSLLLELLELLCCDEADWFVPCDQLGASRHGGQDDVPAQTADTGQTGGWGWGVLVSSKHKRNILMSGGLLPSSAQFD